MHTRKFTHWLAAVSAATMLTLAFPAQGQQAPTEPAPAAGAQAPISDAKLQQFAVAFADVMALQQQFARELENVESRDQAQKMQREVQMQMVKAVEEAGMSVEQYNEVASRADQDPELRQRVLEMVEPKE